MRKVKLANGQIVKLSKGEITAIRRMVEMNGKTGLQFNPGHVAYTTVRNLIGKGILVQTDQNVPEFAPGVF